MKKDQKFAFALGGLAGNNAYGAGFLQAALDRQITPMMISCTSGQIRWATHYLNALKAHKQHGTSTHNVLRQELQRVLATVKKTGEINTDLAIMGMFGIKNIMRPAYEHLLPDLIRNATDVATRTLGNRGQILLAEQMLSVIPGRTMIPQFSPTFYQDTADVLNDTDIGIAFNAYNPQEGEEYVYLNAAARKLMKDGNAPKKYDDNEQSEHRPYRYYRDITAQSVDEALWLYQYGFNDESKRFVDGAYFRDIMLAELVPADVIYAVRPINHKWLGEMPRSYPAIEDMKTEVGFNGCYAAERDQIMLINKLLSKQYLSAERAHEYHHIHLVELEIQIQRGYFGYAFESEDVFTSSEQQAHEAFNHLK